MKVLLVSTYELGRQPFGLASPAAWLRREGCEVHCIDLALDRLDPIAVEDAELVAFHLPMHTATRLAATAVEKVKSLNPRAHLCFYGLYAPPNETYLRALGGRTILGGEFENGLTELVRRLRNEDSPGSRDQPGPVVSLERQRFVTPDRSGLPALDRYARLRGGTGEERTVGYTEASRGCKHLCRHCPIVPVYNGRFRIVQPEVVLADVRQQVAAGARHVTFGDPDFFNGPLHAMQVVESLHGEFPGLTYDVTIKVEHLLEHSRHLRRLSETGCLFVTTAVESFDDRVLRILDKGHTRAEFLEAVRLSRDVGLDLVPTFVAFTPWLTREGYVEVLRTILELDLVGHVAPVQYAIRLLIPASSRLLELDDVRRIVGAFDPKKLVWPWAHADPGVDRLQQDVLVTVQEAQRRREERRTVFGRVWRLAHAACDRSVDDTIEHAESSQAPPRATVPYLTEPWYC